MNFTNTVLSWWSQTPKPVCSMSPFMHSSKRGKKTLWWRKTACDYLWGLIIGNCVKETFRVGKSCSLTWGLISWVCSSRENSSKCIFVIYVLSVGMLYCSKKLLSSQNEPSMRARAHTHTHTHPRKKKWVLNLQHFTLGPESRERPIQPFLQGVELSAKVRKRNQLTCGLGVLHSILNICN